MLICGASFAGLAVARELAGTGARVLVVDRYEIGERQTSACAAPTAWLEAMGVERSMRQSFDTLVVHTPHTTARMRLPWTFSTFDYSELCGLLWEQCEAEFETATVTGRGDVANGTEALVVTTDRGELAAPLVVDALGWRRVLAPGGDVYQPPDAPLSRGLEVHPWGVGDELEIWIDRGYVPAGYSWSFPAADEVRVGVGSFDPRFHVKEPTVRLADDLDREAVRYQGNWIPHRLREATAERRLLRRRLGRPLPAADRRGNPNRLLLRHRLRPGAAGGARRQLHPGAGARALSLVLSGPRVEVPLDASHPASGAAGAATAARAGVARHGDRRGSCAGRSTTTSTSPRRISPGRFRRRRPRFARPPEGCRARSRGARASRESSGRARRGGRR